MVLDVWSKVNNGLSFKNFGNDHKALYQGRIAIQIFAHHEGKEEACSGGGFG